MRRREVDLAGLVLTLSTVAAVAWGVRKSDLPDVPSNGSVSDLPLLTVGVPNEDQAPPEVVNNRVPARRRVPDDDDDDALLHHHHYHRRSDRRPHLHPEDEERMRRRRRRPTTTTLSVPEMKEKMAPPMIVEEIEDEIEDDEQDEPTIVQQHQQQPFDDRGTISMELAFKNVQLNEEYAEYAARFLDLDCRVNQPKKRKSGRGGDSIIKDGSISANKNDLKVTWLKNDQVIANPNDRRGEEPYLWKRKRQVLHLLNLTPDDRGNYTCLIQNKDGGNISRSFRVLVETRLVAQKPLIKAGEPGNHTILVGSNLTLRCPVVVEDISSPTRIVWLMHEAELGDIQEQIEQWLRQRNSPDGFATLDGNSDENNNTSFLVLQICGLNGICNFNTKEVMERPSELQLFDVNYTAWISCVVSNGYGFSLASGLVRVVSELEADPSLAWEHTTLVYGTSFSVVVLVLMVVLLVMCLRIHFTNKKCQEIERGARSVIKWTNRVIVMYDQNQDQECMGGGSNCRGSPSNLAPRVVIQRCRVEPPTQSRGSSYDYNYNYNNNSSEFGEYEFELDPSWEVERSTLTFGEVLGEGAFGRVVKAEVRSQQSSGGSGSQRNTVSSVVAVKMLKEGHTDSDVIDLVSEMAIMKMIGRHENIINLVGVCTRPIGNPLLVVVEYAPHGNLKNYLLSRRPPDYDAYLSDDNHCYEAPIIINNSCSSSEKRKPVIGLKQQLNIAWQVASGMQFLASRRCVHRDLAARNVLVCDNNVFKIADFGMARDIKSADYYRRQTNGKVPVKWMAPESIFDQVYTCQSDVWSYGVLLWEIMSYGENPYRDINVDLLVELLRVGQTMGRPAKCPDKVYKLMWDCWRLAPEDRPQWCQIVERTKDLCCETLPNEYLTLMASVGGEGTSSIVSTGSVASFKEPYPNEQSAPDRSSLVCSNGIGASRHYSTMVNCRKNNKNNDGLRGNHQGGDDDDQLYHHHRPLLWTPGPTLVPQELSSRFYLTGHHQNGGRLSSWSSSSSSSPYGRTVKPAFKESPSVYKGRLNVETRHLQVVPYCSDNVSYIALSRPQCLDDDDEDES